MSRRSSRKRKSNPSEISSAYYVGYAEDEEPVEVIMKKFEELDRLKNELADKKKKALDQDGSSCSKGGDAQCDVSTSMIVVENDDSRKETELTQQDLEELFKRTSSFTIKQVSMGYNPDDFDDIELLRMEYDDIDEFEEENNYEILPNEFADDLDDDLGHKRRGPRYHKSRTDHQSYIEKYRLMQIEMNDNAGTYFIHKKVPYIDPTLPTYIRIPSEPLPRSWSHIIKPMESTEQKELHCSRQFHTKDLLSFDLSSLGKQHIAIYFDLPLLLPSEEYSSGKISVEMLSNLQISSIMGNGFIFIWTEKELTPHVIKMGHKWGFRYVENLAWIKLNNDNTIARQKYKYVSKSRCTCLILRREMSDGEDIELKHQRNADCVFDFIKNRKEGDLAEEKPGYIYDVIETLLPTAIYKHGASNFDKPRILEVSWKVIDRREGWDQIVVGR